MRDSRFGEIQAKWKRGGAVSDCQICHLFIFCLTLSVRYSRVWLLWELLLYVMDLKSMVHQLTSKKFGTKPLITGYIPLQPRIQNEWFSIFFKNSFFSEYFDGKWLEQFSRLLKKTFTHFLQKERVIALIYKAFFGRYFSIRGWSGI